MIPLNYMHYIGVILRLTLRCSFFLVTHQDAANTSLRTAQHAANDAAAAATTAAVAWPVLLAGAVKVVRQQGQHNSILDVWLWTKLVICLNG